MCKFLAFTFCMSLELRPWHVFVQFVCFSLKSKMLNIFLLNSDLSFNQSNTQGYWNIYIQRLMDNNVENVAVMVILYSTIFLFNSRVFSLLYLSAVCFISFPFKPATFWLAVSVTSQRPKSREKWSETDCLEKSETWSWDSQEFLVLADLIQDEDPPLHYIALKSTLKDFESNNHSLAALLGTPVHLLVNANI